MKGRVGKHHAQAAVPAKLTQGVRLLLFAQDNGTSRALQNPSLRPADPAEPLRLPEGSAHDSQRFCLPVLYPPQPLHCARISRIAGQMNPADSLHGQDTAREEHLLGQAEGISRRPLPGAVQKVYGRPAHRAAVRLCVIAPVLNVPIFLPAGRTHGEILHRGAGPVIGKSLYNGKAGAAIGTVDKRIPEPAV